MWRFRCGHKRVRCVHGDVIVMANYRRRACLDCGRYLKGPLPDYCNVTLGKHSSGKGRNTG